MLLAGVGVLRLGDRRGAPVRGAARSRGAHRRHRGGDPPRADRPRARPGRCSASPSSSTGFSRSSCGCSARRPARTEADQSRVVLAAVVTAFIAFTGIATLVPGGLAEPGGTARRRPGDDRGLARGAGGQRRARRPACSATGWPLLRYGTAMDAARSAVTSAIVVAVAAGALRPIDLPRLVGPAVLTLVFYLWDALHGSRARPPPRAALPVGDDPARGARGRRGRLEPASSRLTPRRSRTAARALRRLTERAGDARNTCPRPMPRGLPLPPACPGPARPSATERTTSP